MDQLEEEINNNTHMTNLERIALLNRISDLYNTLLERQNGVGASVGVPKKKRAKTVSETRCAGPYWRTEEFIQTYYGEKLVSTTCESLSKAEYKIPGDKNNPARLCNTCYKRFLDDKKIKKLNG